MSCFNQCTDLVVYDYAYNGTVKLNHCTCTGCCYRINVIINLFMLFFIFYSFIFIHNLNKKYRDRRVLIHPVTQEERLPEYTETI